MLNFIYKYFRRSNVYWIMPKKDKCLSEDEKKETEAIFTEKCF